MPLDYAAYRYGGVPYMGGQLSAVTPEDFRTGIPFIVANDRYQVIVCADRGTTTSVPQFRYWWANGQGWAHELAGDDVFPSYFSLDEVGNTTVGELQTAPNIFESVRTATGRYRSADIQVDHILVDFIPRPVSVTSETVPGGERIKFTGQVVGYGITDYNRELDTSTSTTSAAVFTGTAKSGTYTYMSTVAEEDWDVWPPIRSVKLPVRFGVRCRSIRAILTDIQHCEIVRIAIMGDLTGTRET